MEFTAEQIDQLRSAFLIYTKGHSSKATKEDIAIILRSLNPKLPNEWFKRIIVQVNKGGQIVGFDELIQLVRQIPKEEVTADQVRKAFRLFDKDGTGSITIGKLHMIMTNLGNQQLTEEEFEEMISDMDTDNEENIDYEKFIELFKSN